MYTITSIKNPSVVMKADDKETALKIEKQLKAVYGYEWTIKEAKDVWELTYSR